MQKSKTGQTLITGGTGLMGTALRAKLEDHGHAVVSIGSEVDLRLRENVVRVFDEINPTQVFHLAARVGGIVANNSNKNIFYTDNVLINTNVISQCLENDVEYVFALGTGCAYPKRLEGSLLKESDYLDGEPEKTNDAYAYAKRGMLVHLNSIMESSNLDFTYCVPANIYGPNDNFHKIHSHVVPGLIRRFADATNSKVNSVTVWGDGSAERDFLYIDDCVNAILVLATNRILGAVNIASGTTTPIAELADIVKRKTAFAGDVIFDNSYPTGQVTRIFDTSIIRETGWTCDTLLDVGIGETVNWFLNHREMIRER